MNIYYKHVTNGATYIMPHIQTLISLVKLSIGSFQFVFTLSSYLNGLFWLKIQVFRNTLLTKPAENNLLGWFNVNKIRDLSLKVFSDALSLLRWKWTVMFTLVSWLDRPFWPDIIMFWAWISIWANTQEQKLNFLSTLQGHIL